MSENKYENRLMELMSAYYYSQGLYCVALFRIPDHLKAGPLTAVELAKLTGTDPGVLYRLLRAMTTIDVFDQDGDTFSLTPMSELLCSDVARTQWAKTLVMVGDWPRWGQLPDVLRTGKPPVVDYGDLKPEDEEEMSAIFDQAMNAFYYDAPAPMLGIYDFSDAKVVCDIGGGNGAQLAAVLKAYPHLQGMVFELPETIEHRTRAYIEAEGLSDRCQLVGGDFFKSVPAGADIYMMRAVIHNWDDEKSVTILSNVAEVLPENGKVLVVDWVIRDDDPKSFNKWWDMMNLMFGGGAERTPAEHAALFEKAGLKFTRCIPVHLDNCVVEAVKA